MSVGLALLAAHALGDFPLQDDRMADAKLFNSLARAKHSLIHAGLVLLFTLPVAGGEDAAAMCAFVAAAHFVIDSRRWAEPKEDKRWWPMAVDQSMHLASLWAASLVVIL